MSRKRHDMKWNVFGDGFSQTYIHNHAHTETKQIVLFYVSFSMENREWTLHTLQNTDNKMTTNVQWKVKEIQEYFVT